jgi:hypothetical protein
MAPCKKPLENRLTLILDIKFYKLWLSFEQFQIEICLAHSQEVWEGVL